MKYVKANVRILSTFLDSLIIFSKEQKHSIVLYLYHFIVYSVDTDTERLYTVAIQELASEYNKQYTWDIKVRCMGMRGDLSAKIIVESLELPITPEEYMQRIDVLYKKIFSLAKLLPGISIIFADVVRAMSRKQNDFGAPNYDSKLLCMSLIIEHTLFKLNCGHDLLSN